MLNVDNRKAISLLSRRSLAASRLRNLVAIIAIALTAVLFTSLFTIGGSMIDSMERSTMRQVGTQSHAGFKYLTPEQYDILQKDPELADISYNIIAGFAANPELNKLQCEVRYTEEKAAQWGFSEPTTGSLPKDTYDLATSTLVLDALGLPYELGQQIPLDIDVDGHRYQQDFTLCGFWQGDQVAGAQQIFLSRAYIDRIAPPLTQPMYESGNTNMGGSINADVWFQDSWDIEGQVDALIARCGLDPRVDTGINWAYSSSAVDLTTIMMVAGMLLIILLSGYLIIYNIFYISVAHDIRFYGLLKTIGTTGRQLKRIVRRQALLLSCIGIPIGLICGFAIGSMLVPVVMKITSMG